ncbi:hypothetical protein D5086_022987, partial [Populus alba]
MRLENNNKWRRGGRIQWKNGFFLCRRHQPSLQDPWRRPPLCPFSYSSCLVLNQLDRSSLPSCFPKESFESSRNIDRDSPLTANRVSEILVTCANTLAVGL